MKRIFSLFLMLVGTLAYLFFKNYQGGIIPFLGFCQLSSAIIVFWGVGVLLVDNYSQEQHEPSKSQGEIDRLKAKGEVINVDLKHCEIISNHYYKELPANSFYTDFWNNLSFNQPKPKQSINRARLIYKHPDDDNKPIYISPIIEKDMITLNFMIHKIGNTKIYADPQDQNSFYFDLEFLH